MLVALFISIFVAGIFYFFQKYPLNQMNKDIISGGNDLMGILAILVVAWSLGAASQDLPLSSFIQNQLGHSFPACSFVFDFWLRDLILVGCRSLK